ncbi:MAG TPA: CHAT domain-containing protein [Pseudomonadota bacterium]|nr:CHAT domain-containing protein [Pseudomonadota bacterium]
MPVNILLSYSERDIEAARELERHLTPLARAGKISLWDRDMVIGGEDQEREWLARVTQAPIIILLVSADLEIDRDRDIADALVQRQLRGARVIPVLWRPVNIKDLRYKELRMIPDGRAVAERRDRDQAWVEVVQGIRKVVEALEAQGASRSVAPPVVTVERTAPPPPPGVIRILFLGANPSDYVQLNLPKERHEIDRRIQTGPLRDRFELKDAWAVTAADLSTTLLRYKPAILHFSGHGLAQGELLLNDDSGRAAPVSAAALSNLFKLFAAKGLRCVVLNACYSAVQAAAMAKHVDCVIGISGEIEDRAAQAFTSGFYAGLAQGEPLQSAFDFGCLQIQLMNLPNPEQPQLLGRAGVDLDTLHLV